MNLSKILEKQRVAFSQNPYPSLKERKDRLLRLKKLMKENHEQLVQAMSDDFGHRASFDSYFGDIIPVMNNINYCLSKTRKWMKPKWKNPGLALFPAILKLMYQPKGVVGIIVPWNFPLMLSLGPLAFILAAGNRAMIKTSEFNPKTSALLKELVERYFSEEEVKVVEGDVEVAREFSSLNFDHILFTGSTNVGKLVMKAASENLTPVTLELGGKSPAIIDNDIDLETAVDRVIFGKTLNAGQICVAPDYILIPRGKMKSFATLYKKRFNELYNSESKDYTSIINEGHYKRVCDWLEEARNSGAEVIDCGENLNSDELRRLSTQLVLDPKDDLIVKNEEIFGPVLPVIPYDNFDEAINYVKERPRPLASYLMSFNPKLHKAMARSVHAGSLAINDTVMQVAADDAPFGGIGPSGMGHYHGEEGFKTFSHAKTILKRGRLFNTTKLLYPPYGNWLQNILIKFFMR